MLPVSVPELTDGRSLSAWRPGQTLASDEGYPHSSCEGLCFTGGTLALVIVVPLVVFFAIIGCCTVCCCRLSKKRRQKTAGMVEGAQLSTIEASQRRALEEMGLDPDTQGEAYGLKPAAKPSAKG